MTGGSFRLLSSRNQGRAILALVALALVGSACKRRIAKMQCPPFPAIGVSLDATRESYRRSELRRQLRYREATAPGYTLQATGITADQAKIDQNQVCAVDLYETGRILFEHAFTPPEGAPIERRRVQLGRRGGPETTSCTSCHWRGGPAGAGSVVDNSFLLGDHDRVSSGDARNPPSLAGAGVVQALSQEMTAELAQLRATAIRSARSSGKTVEVEMVSKGVSFGTVQFTRDGRMQRGSLEGIDPDLVVRPFGWKGTSATLAEFIAESTVLHFGITSAETLANNAQARYPLEVAADAVAELTAGQLTALVMYVAALDVPQVIAPMDATNQVAYLPDAWAQGRGLFETVGCASCHVPRMVLSKPVATIYSSATGGSLKVDLLHDAETPRLVPAQTGPRNGANERTLGAGSGYVVELFSDLKRHDLGAEVASLHVHGGITPRLYLTRPLWGLADSAPYFHDGGAATVDAAVLRHNGEAGLAHDNWDALSIDERNALRLYLMSLRRAPRVQNP
jgi:mono/diheme cytochrome c family protein